MDSYTVKCFYLKKALIAFVVLMLLPITSLAEDIEVYFQKPETRTNIMFLLDTSDSMRRCNNLNRICLDGTPARFDVLKQAMSSVVDYLHAIEPNTRVGLAALTGSTSQTLLDEDGLEVGGGRPNNLGATGGFILYPLKRLDDLVVPAGTELDENGNVKREPQTTTVTLRNSGDVFAAQNKGEPQSNSDNINKDRLYFPGGHQVKGVSAQLYEGVNVPKGAHIDSAKIVMVAAGSNVEGCGSWWLEPELYRCGSTVNLYAYYEVGRDLGNFKHQPILTKDAEPNRRWVPTLSMNDTLVNMPSYSKINNVDIDVRIGSELTIDITEVISKAVADDNWCGQNDIALAFRQQDLNAIKWRRVRHNINKNDIPKLVIEWRMPEEKYTEDGALIPLDTCAEKTRKILSSTDNAMEDKSSQNVKTFQEEESYGEEEDEKVKADSNNVLKNPVSVGMDNNILALRFQALGLKPGDEIKYAMLKLPVKYVSRKKDLIDKIKNKRESKYNTEGRFVFDIYAAEDTSAFESTDLQIKLNQALGIPDFDKAKFKHSNSIWQRNKIYSESLDSPNKKLFKVYQDSSASNARAIRKSLENKEGGEDNLGFVKLDITDLARKSLCSLEDGQLSCAENNLLLMIDKITLEHINKDTGEPTGATESVTMPIYLLEPDISTKDSDSTNEYWVPSIELQFNTNDMSSFMRKEADKIKEIVDRLSTTGSSLYKPIDAAYLEVGRYLMGKNVYFGNGKYDLNNKGAVRARAVSHPESMVGGKTDKTSAAGIDNRRPQLTDPKYCLSDACILRRSIKHRQEAKKWSSAVSKNEKETYRKNNYPSLDELEDTTGHKRYQIADHKNGEGLGECEKNAVIIITDGRWKNQLTSKVPGELANAFGIKDVNGKDIKNCGVSVGSVIGGWFDPAALFTNEEDRKPYACSVLFARHLAHGGGDDEEIQLGDYVAKIKPNDKHNSVATHTVAFRLNSEATSGQKKRTEHTLAAMKMVSDAGKGLTIKADNRDELVEALKKIVNLTVLDNVSMAAPGIAIDQSTKLEHLDEVYYGLFKPQNFPVWPGNLKKYKVSGLGDDAQILDQNDRLAVSDQTGTFTSSSSSFWSLVEVDGTEVAFPDGDSVDLGGALHQLQTSTSERNLLTSQFGSEKELKSVFAIEDESAFRIDGDTLEFKNDDLVKVKEWLKTAWGDVLHSEARLISYPQSSDGSSYKNVVYVSDNSGILHAVDAETGKELFGFIPKEELKKSHRRFWSDQTASPMLLEDNPGGQLGALRDSEQSKFNAYGLDGTWTFWRNGEKVYAFGGQRRGGSNYYALDVSDPHNQAPKLMWQISGDSFGSGFERLGQTWSEPQLGKVRVNNKDVAVLVFAAGYDKKNDNDKQGSLKTGLKGNDLFIVNAITGELLWSASKYAASKVVGSMNYSIPATPALVDVDGDGYFDFIYVGDLGGQIFRFDMQGAASISSNNLEQLVQGSYLIAQLSNNGEDARRFYNTPSVALSDKGLLIVIGSGYRAHPLSEYTQDYIYGLYDETALSRSEGEVITHAPSAAKSLARVDVENSAGVDVSNASGWYLPLQKSKGEKVLAEANIVNGVAFITTFTTETKNVDACNTIVGKSRLYAIDAYNGGAIYDEADGFEGGGNRYKVLSVIGIPPKPQVLISKNPDISGEDGSCNRSLVGIVGTETFKIGSPNLCGFERTRWFEASEEKAEKLLQ